MKVKLYDFDRTIYDGDSTLDFFKFSILRNPKLIKYMPRQCSAALLYILGFIPKRKFKEEFFIFLKDLEDVDEMISQFWDKNEIKIKRWFTDASHTNVIILSSSPDFLLSPIAQKLGVRDIIATDIDKQTGLMRGRNCYGIEKVRRLNIAGANYTITEAYSDSMSDLPMLSLAAKQMIVIGNKITPLHEYKPSGFRKLKTLFISRKFLAFLVVGGVNTIMGVLFAYLYSLVLENAKVAFVVGYITSLVLSYYLNSAVTFRNATYSLFGFLKFSLSYIPNFSLQLLCVKIFVDTLSLDALIAYMLSALIGLPITFALLSLYTFRNIKEKKRSNLG